MSVAAHNQPPPDVEPIDVDADMDDGLGLFRAVLVIILAQGFVIAGAICIGLSLS